MKVTTVRYKIAHDRIDENIQLVHAVFAQLEETAPDGLRYASVHTEDGSFMHVVHVYHDAAEDALTSLPAFHDFRTGLKERAVEGPTFTDFEIIGNYGIF